MIAIDTNVLVRLLINDDQNQVNRAVKLLAMQESVFVALPVLMETLWVAKSVYKHGAERVLAAMRSVLDTQNFQIQDHAAVRAALIAWQAHGGDLTDHIIACVSAAHGAIETFSFDERACDSAGMSPLP